ncbi:MAG: DUF4440 domain-containing protein [Proteobacteria bacterium]|nr:DUF4440 domain-containing protein [Pseudomonadota bacterium]
MKIYKLVGRRTAQVFLAGVFSILLGTSCSGGDEHTLSTTDIDAIMAADYAFATAWLENDPSKVMATLTPDAVIIPSGKPPIEGAAAIQETWWPADSVPTLVTEFKVDQRESGGSGDVGFVRGSYSLAFEVDGTTFTYTGEYLCLLRRDPDGSWRISHRMWGGRERPLQTE